jgi:hypothetical protein
MIDIYSDIFRHVKMVLDNILNLWVEGNAQVTFSILEAIAGPAQDSRVDVLGNAGRCKA